MQNIVINEDSFIHTTSLLVAEKFNKRHADVIRAISNIECSEDFTKRNFALCFKNNDLQNGKPQKYYKMTKDGFVFLVMGFTGKQAAEFKESYIEAFNEMHDYVTKEQNTLLAQFSAAMLEYEKFTDLASQAGRTLALVGKKLKPRSLEKVEELKEKIQPSLFID